jgi:dihydrofolate reductase
MDRNGLIGNQGSLPWHIPEDLAYFKAVTMGHPIIMGKKTWRGIRKPLPGRQNIVLSHDFDFIAEGATVVPDIVSALELCHATEVFVIGGANIFQQFLPFADKLYITLIDTEFEGDTWFPSFNEADWFLLKSSSVTTALQIKLHFNVYVYKTIIYDISEQLISEFD